MKKNEKGQAMIIVAVTLISLLCLLALVVDTGRIYIEHAKLQRTVDSMALAGAQVLPDVSKAKTVIEEAGTLNKLDLNNYELQFTGPDSSGNNTAVITAYKKVSTRLANFFNTWEPNNAYSNWTITAQAIARNGPISEIQHWIPIAVEDPQDKLLLYQHYRLTNTTHESANASDIKLKYFPLNYGGNIKDGVRDNVASRTNIGRQYNIQSPFKSEDVCDGIDQRIRNRLAVAGCFKVGQTIDLSRLNIVGPGSSKDWHFGEDPRLTFVPFVKQVAGGKLEIVGFGLFYIEYAHYDPNPPGGTEPMTEIVGFFVQTIVEGPIVDTAKNYGVIGIEYLDINKFSIK